MSDTVYVLDQVGIRLVKEKTLISDTQLKRPEQVVGKHVLPVRPGRKDPCKVKPQAFVSFLYRVV